MIPIIFYMAILDIDGPFINIRFPDCPGCQTFTYIDGDIFDVARDALDGWLESMLDTGQVPQRPSDIGKPYDMHMIGWISVSEELSNRLLKMWEGNVK